jgi:CelD/BcsL family acetyltransferase involved in cellulose biosynthesis
MSARWLDPSDPSTASALEKLATSLKAGPFMRPGWFAAWSRAFGETPLVAAAPGNSLQALAPLLRTRKSLRSPVNEHSPEFSFLAESDDAAVGLTSSLFNESPTSLQLLKVPAATRDAVVAAAERSSYRVVASVMQRSPYLDLSGSWDDYEGSLSANFRQSMRRKKRRLDDEGDLSIETHDGHENLQAILDEGFAVEPSRWKAKEGTAITSDARTRAFYSAVAEWASERGWLRLVFLRLDGNPIAFRLDLVADGGYYHLKGGYDPAFGRFSPGLVLQHETVRTAFEEGLDRYEFLGADEPYKLMWTSTRRDRFAVRCFAPTPAGRLAWARRAWVAPALRKIKRSSTK